MIEIVPLTSDRWESFAADFSRVPNFNWCWCQYWRLRSKEFGSRRVAELRGSLRELANGPIAPGLVALDDVRAVGWVGLGPRGDFERLTRSRTIPRVDGSSVWSIVCFTVSRSARRQGIGAALLDAAVAYAAENGARTLEAYPVDVGPEGALAADLAYTGTRAMFERAGFEAVSTTASTAGGHPRVLVRRTVMPSP